MSEFLIYFGIFAAVAGASYAVYHFFIKKDDWAETQANSPIDVPVKLPNVSYSAKGVKVYCNELVPRPAYEALDRAIQKQIDILSNDIPQFVPVGVAKKWTRFKKHSEYNVLLLPPTYRSQSTDYPNAPLLTMKSGQTVIGTVIGFANKSGVIKGKQPFIVLPVPENVANWLELWEAGAFNESQHYALIQGTSEATYFFLAYSGAGDSHPLYGHAMQGFRSQAKADDAGCGMK